MAHIPLFLVLMIGSCGYALVRGGAPERLTALIFLAGSMSWTLVGHWVDAPFGRFHFALFAVDAAMLAGLWAIAERSTRYWPLWMAALQVWQVASHFAIWLPAMLSLVFSFALAFWAYPMLIILAVATLRHRLRVRVGTDPAWSSNRS